MVYRGGRRIVRGAVRVKPLSAAEQGAQRNQVGDFPLSIGRRVRGRQRGGSFAVDDAVLHYKGNFLQRCDVVKRIAGNRDYIGGVARLEDADFILPAQ